ncbi:ACP S-malonyltransferase [Maledivibacter halophilus]|uniref:Malonyl CoA-acyl carrier protein transacylase n=1 Tax=Maledivibacter halophilus TaxID=36842 RepID=A0A1T5MFW7_9FIRM|nr:ACP S-malonyltransferase [Maledivibacter halophilus]SKC87130.1 [Acyl-carrier-protein] S-malonyltransferase [Maledivibacter halophilus]
MKNIAFVFPGQGAQYVGMGKEFVENFNIANDIFERASDSLGYDMKELCFEGPEDELKKTENTQPAILTVSIAAYEVLIKHGYKPKALAGLSLGEFSALVASNVMSFEEAVKVVRKRGRYMQQEVPLGVGTMAAFIGLDREKVIEACNKASQFGVVEPANFNSPIQTVISGEIKAVEKAVQIGKELGAKKAKVLNVSAPFHSSMLKGAGEKLSKELDKIEFKEFTYPIVANVTAEYYNSVSQVSKLLVKQVSNSVLWEDSVKRMIKDGIDTFVEVGPGKALSGFIKRISRNVQILNVEDMESLEKTLKALE